MPDEEDRPPSNWTHASSGLYGLTLEELKLALDLAYAYLTQHGREMTPTELRILLRKPGA